MATNNTRMRIKISANLSMVTKPIIFSKQLNQTIINHVNPNWEFMLNGYYKVNKTLTHNDYVPVLFDRLIRARYRYYHLNHVYMCRQFLVYGKEALYYDTQQPQNVSRINVVASFSNAVHIRMYWMVFGHFIHDFLATLVLYPKEVLELPNLVILHNYEDPKILQNHLPSLGFGHVKTLFLDYHDLVFVHNLHYIRPEELTHELDALGLPLISERFRKTLNLDKILPTKYNIINRKKSERRHFTNVPELMEGLKTHFPAVQFQQMDLGKTINETALLFAETKVLIGSAGSILFNIVFMSIGTGVVCIMADKVDLPNHILCGLLGIYSVGIYHEHINIYEGTGDMNIPEVLDAVRIVLYCVENKHYPKMTGYRPAVTLKKFFETKMKSDVNSGVTIGHYTEPVIE